MTIDSLNNIIKMMYMNGYNRHIDISYLVNVETLGEMNYLLYSDFGYYCEQNAH